MQIVRRIILLADIRRVYEVFLNDKVKAFQKRLFFSNAPYGKALRFSLKGTVNTFNAWIENDCGETLRCNFFGWFDDFGFLRNFDYDCVPNLEIMAAREVVKNRILEEKATAEQMRLEKVADVNRLFNEGRESGEARLEGRRRAL